MPGAGILQPTQAQFNTGRGIAYASYDSRDDLGAGGRLHAQLFASAQRDRFIDPNGQVGVIPARTDDSTLSAGVTANASRPLADWVRGAAMIEARRETFQPINQLEATPVGVPAERLVGAAGVETDFWWRRIDLDIVPSARVEVLRDIVTGRDAVFQRQRPARPPILQHPANRAPRPVAAARVARDAQGQRRPLQPRAVVPRALWRHRADAGQSIAASRDRLERRSRRRVPSGRRARVGTGRTGLFAARVDDLIEGVPISYSQWYASTTSAVRDLGRRAGAGRSISGGACA